MATIDDLSLDDLKALKSKDLDAMSIEGLQILKQLRSGQRAPDVTEEAPTSQLTPPVEANAPSIESPTDVTAVPVAEEEGEERPGIFKQAIDKSMEGLAPIQPILQGGLAASRAAGQAGEAIDSGLQSLQDSMNEFGRSSGSQEAMAGMPVLQDPYKMANIAIEGSQFMLPKSTVEGGMMLFGGPLADAAVTGSANLLAKGMSRTLSPETQAMFLSARAHGIDLMPSDLKISESLEGIETAMKAIPGTSWIMKKIRDMEFAQLKKVQDKIIEKVGGGQNSEAVGNATNAALRVYEEKWTARAGVHYQRAADFIPQHERVPVGDLVKLSRNLVDEVEKGLVKDVGDALDVAKRIVSGADDSIAKQTESILLAKREAGEFPALLSKAEKDLLDKNIPYSTFALWRSQLSGAAGRESIAHKLGQPTLKGMGTKKGLAYSQLLDEATVAEGKFLETLPEGEGRKALKFARALWQKKQQTFNNDVIRSMLNKKNADKMVDKVFVKNASATIVAVKKALPKEDWLALRSTFVDKLMEGKGFESVVSQEFARSGYSPTRLLQKLGQYDAPTLKQIFSKSELDELVELANISNAVIGGVERTTNFSHSGNELISAGVLGMMVSDPIGTGVLILKGSAMAALYTSKAGRELLINGFKIQASGNQVEAAKWFVKMSAFLSAKAGRKLGEANDADQETK